MTSYNCHDVTIMQSAQLEQSSNRCTKFGFDQPSQFAVTHRQTLGHLRYWRYQDSSCTPIPLTVELKQLMVVSLTKQSLVYLPHNYVKLSTQKKI